MINRNTKKKLYIHKKKNKTYKKKKLMGMRSVSKSFWSFLDSPDIQQAFTFTAGDWPPESTGYLETKVPSDGFVDA